MSVAWRPLKSPCAVCRLVQLAEVTTLQANQPSVRPSY